jgi:thioredoxin 2
MNTIVVCSQCEKVNRVDLERVKAAEPLCGSCQARLPLKEGVQEVSSLGLEKLLAHADRPIVVDFWAEWCGPCKAFAPTFKAAARELGGHFLFVKVDTEKEPGAAEKFRIRSIPTLIVFKDGNEVERQSGAMPLPMFVQFLNQWKA